MRTSTAKFTLFIIALLAPYAILRTHNIFIFLLCLAYILFTFFQLMRLYFALAVSEKKSVEAPASRKNMFMASTVVLIYLAAIVYTLVITYPFWSEYLS